MLVLKKNKYFGDAALSVAVGKFSDEKQKLMDVTERSLYLGIEQLKEGNRLGDYSSTVQSLVEKTDSR